MTKKPEKVNSKDLGNHTLDVILDNNPLDMNSVSGLLEWIHEVSGHKDGCPVLFVDDGWFSDPDFYKKVDGFFTNIYFQNCRFKSQQQREAGSEWLETTFFEIDKKGNLKKCAICVYGEHDYWHIDPSSPPCVATINFEFENNRLTNKWVDHFWYLTEDRDLPWKMTEYTGEDTLENIYKEIYGITMERDNHFYFNFIADPLFETEYDGDSLKKISFSYINERFRLTQLSFDLEI